jgi:hypothetical protein
VQSISQEGRHSFRLCKCGELCYRELVGHMACERAWQVSRSSVPLLACTRWSPRAHLDVLAVLVCMQDCPKLQASTFLPTSECRLSIANLKTWNPKCFQIQNFMNADVMPQVENSILDLMWQAAFMIQAEWRFCIKYLWQCEVCV